MSADVRALLRSCCVHAASGSGRCACASPGEPPAEWVETAGPGPGAAMGAGLQLQAGRAATRENRVRLLLDGSESYGAMLDLVEEAREEVLFENFIFRGDAVGLAFAVALRRRAEEGVRVRVLHDPFGALMSRRAPIGFHFHGSPAWVRVYNPPRPTPAFFRDGRDHRKLVVQDRRRAVVGGLCLADAWMGNCVERCTWRDSAILVEGAAAEEVAAEFDRMWGRGRSFTPRIAQEGGAAAPVAIPHTDAAPGDVPVRVLSDEPGARRTERVLVHALDTARSEALLTTPYLLPTPRLAEAMCAAARRGVDVEVLVPLHGNHRVVALSAEHAAGELLRAGVTVWQWTGPLVHAKTAVVDACWSLVGSSNLDPLSLIRNAELNLEVHGAAFAGQLRASFIRDRALSSLLSEETWRGRPPLRRLLTRTAALGRGWQ